MRRLRVYAPVHDANEPQGEPAALSQSKLLIYNRIFKDKKRDIEVDMPIFMFESGFYKTTFCTGICTNFD